MARVSKGSKTKHAVESAVVIIMIMIMMIMMIIIITI